MRQYTIPSEMLGRHATPASTFRQLRRGRHGRVGLFCKWGRRRQANACFSNDRKVLVTRPTGRKKINAPSTPAQLGYHYRQGPSLATGHSQREAFYDELGHGYGRQLYGHSVVLQDILGDGYER